jgi:hypothetical protein
VVFPFNVYENDYWEELFGKFLGIRMLDHNLT